MAEVLSFSDIAESSQRNGDSNQQNGKVDNNGCEVIPKKKAATKRCRPVVTGKPCTDIYKVSDNFFRFDYRTVKNVMIDSDEDDDEIDKDNWNLSPVKRPRLRRPKNDAIVLSSEEDDDDDDLTHIGIETPDKNNTSSISNRSPSPPPPSPPIPLDVIVPARRQRQLNKVLRNVDKAVDSIYNTSTFPSPIKNSPAADDSFMSPPEDKTLKVKITCKLGVLRYDMKMNDHFGVIMKSLAEKLQVEVDQIILTLKDDSIIASDTPQSINLRITDIIDCVVASALSSDNDTSLEGQDVVHIKVQGGNRASNKVIAIRKTDPLEKLIAEYCKVTDTDRSKRTFIFDGDRVSPDDTPEDLDMENDDVIDVLVTG